MDVQYIDITATESLVSSILRNIDYRNKEVRDRERLKKIEKLEKSNVDVDQLLAESNISV